MKISYQQVPNFLVEDSSLDNSALRIWMMFNQFAKLKNWKHCPKYIANKLKISLTTVYKKIKELIKKGYLERVQHNVNEFEYSIPETVFSGVAKICTQSGDSATPKTCVQKTRVQKMRVQKNAGHNNINIYSDLKKKILKENNIGGILRTREENLDFGEERREDSPPDNSSFENFSFSPTNDVNSSDSSSMTKENLIKGHMPPVSVANTDSKPLSGVIVPKEKNEGLKSDSRRGEIVPSPRKGSENFEWVREMYVLARPEHWSEEAPYLTRGIVSSLRQSLEVLGGDEEKMKELMLKGYEAIGKNLMLREYDFTWFVSRDRFIELGQEAKNKFCGSISRRTKNQLAWAAEAEQNKAIRRALYAEYQEKKKARKAQFS